MRCVHLRKAKESALIFPIIRGDLFIPVTGHRKVGILIGCLPSITSQRNEASPLVLQSHHPVRIQRNSKFTHIDSLPQMGKILLEQLDNICACRFASRNHNTTSGTGSHGNHFLEGWVLESLNGLSRTCLISMESLNIVREIPGGFQSTIGWPHLGKDHPSMGPPFLEAVPSLDEGRETAALHGRLRVLHPCAHEQLSEAWTGNC